VAGSLGSPAYRASLSAVCAAFTFRYAALTDDSSALTLPNSVTARWRTST
jgi:hypothetical protein